MAKVPRWARRYGVRLLVHLGALIPLGLLVRELLTTQYFVAPIEEVTIRTGRLAITLLLLSLACTPVAALTGFAPVVQARRPLGLWALGYVTLHLLVFVGWDYGFNLHFLRFGILEQPFVLVGMAAFLILLALGVTSIPRVQQSMGRSWRWLQRAVYLAGALAVWHVLWVRKDPREVWWLPVILAVLLALRIGPVHHLVTAARKRVTSKRSEVHEV